MRRLASAAVAAALALPTAAYAATTNAPATPDTMTIRGVIRSIDGKWAVTVHDDHGFVDNVALHRGTIIEPTGLRLAPGMRVSVRGYADQATFDAERIVGPVDAAVTPRGGAEGSTTLVPEEIPNGTFQTEGPTAEGGG